MSIFPSNWLHAHGIGLELLLSSIKIKITCNKNQGPSAKLSDHTCSYTQLGTIFLGWNLARLYEVGKEEIPF